MPRLLLTLLILLFPMPGIHAAISLGDTGDAIIRQYGNPVSFDAGQNLTTYQWTDWRLDINLLQGAAHRLVFTKDGSPVSDAEERQILNDNGGVASWLPVERLDLPTAPVNKWRRTTDSAEAFTSSGTMTLSTKMWVDAQTTKEFYAPFNQQASTSTPSRIVVTAPAVPVGPLAPFMGMLTKLVGLVVAAVILIGIVALLVRQSSREPALRTPKRFRSACTIVPPLPSTADEPTALAEPKTLADLSWQEFELVVGELYGRQGYAVEMCSGDGSDGGVDLRLRKNGETTLVQCKHWKVYRVGVSTVRELFGILTAERADHAILVTTGKFTRDAIAFADGKPLTLIDGARLKVIIEQGSRERRGDTYSTWRVGPRTLSARPPSSHRCAHAAGSRWYCGRQGRAGISFGDAPCIQAAGASGAYGRSWCGGEN